MTVGMRPLTRRAAKDADQGGPLKGDLDAAAGWLQVRQRVCQARDGSSVCLAHLVQVVDEDELGEVVVDRSLGEMAAC